MDFQQDALREKAEDFNNAGNDAYRKKDFAKAIFFYTEGIKVECKDKELVSKLHNNRSTVYFYRGNYQDCLSDVKAATTLQPSYLKAIIRGANACVKLKQFEEAIIWCEKGLAPDINTRGVGRIRDSYANPRRSPRTQPKPLDCTLFAETRKNFGNDAFHKDDFVKAICLYTEGIEVKCKDEDLNAKLYNNRASAHYHFGNYQDCLCDVKAATALQPYYLKAIIRGAKACLKLKQFKEAINWCDKGLAIDNFNKALLEIRRSSVNVEHKLSEKQKEIPKKSEITTVKETVSGRCT
ncbi:Tetratricopeptide repeat protein 4 [Porites harrisoni]